MMTMTIKHFYLLPETRLYLSNDFFLKKEYLNSSLMQDDLLWGPKILYVVKREGSLDIAFICIDTEN